MTHEQRAKSIAQLTKLHENLTKSNSMLINIIQIMIYNILLTLATIDKPRRTTSLIDWNKKPTKLHSVTSLVPERTAVKEIQMQNKTSSRSSTEQNHTDSDQKIDTPTHISEPSDSQIFSSPVKLVSLPSLNSFSERQLSQENIHTIDINDLPETTSAISSPIAHSPTIKPSPSEIKSIIILFFKIHLSTVVIESNKSNTNTSAGKVKKNRNTHFPDTDLTEQPSQSKPNSVHTSDTEQNNTRFPNVSSPIEVKSNTSSSNSIMNTISIEKQQSDSETMSIEKIKEFNQEINLDDNKDSASKQSVKQDPHDLHSKKDTKQSLTASSSYRKTTENTSQSQGLSSPLVMKEKQMPLPSLHFQSSNDENEIENSLNDVTDHLSQQDIIVPNAISDKSLDIPKEFNKTKRALPLLKEIDEVSQHSKSSVSFDTNFEKLKI
jgi:hypothetical protein